MSDALHAARLVLLQAAVLALLSESADQHDQHDGLAVHAHREKTGETTIDITYTSHGVPVAGEGV